MTEPRKGAWLQSVTGRRIYVLDPRPGDFDDAQVEIAEMLSKKARFAGATPGRFYSNAEHCLHVSTWAERIAPPPLKLLCARQALLHDATDAYLPDVPTPIKYGVPAFRDLFKPIEDRLERAIYSDFLVAPTEESYAIVKRADCEVMRAEADCLLADFRQCRVADNRPIHLVHEPAKVEIEAMSWIVAMRAWLDRYFLLWGI